MGRDPIYSNQGVCATVFLDAEVHARLKRDARTRGLSLSRFVNQLGVAYMKANPAPKPATDVAAPVPARKTVKKAAAVQPPDSGRKPCKRTTAVRKRRSA